MAEKTERNPVAGRFPNTIPGTRADFPTISLINASTLVPDVDVSKCRDALNWQLDEGFSAAWGVNADVEFVARGKTPKKKNAWWLVVLDDSDWADALGYHDLTDDGFPSGKVFVRTSHKYGEPWSVTASHEILEMLCDPYLKTMSGPEANGVFYCQEICDAVQDESYQAPNGVAVSNFMFPAWFWIVPAYRGVFDFLKTCKAPFEVRPNGYMPLWSPTKGWHDIWGKSARAARRSRKDVGSRTERRKAGEERWQNSAPDVLAVTSEVAAQINEGTSAEKRMKVMQEVAERLNLDKPKRAPTKRPKQET